MRGFLCKEHVLFDVEVEEDVLIDGKYGNVLYGVWSACEDGIYGGKLIEFIRISVQIE